jgi:ABC-type transport system substrate-binding protein
MSRRTQITRRTVFALAGCLVAMVLTSTTCRRRSDNFVIVLSDNIKTIDPIGSPSVDAASERVRVLMFNSLVKKNEQFDYVPELASNVQRADDGLTFTFTLRDGVTFHDGRQFTSADAVNSLRRMPNTRSTRYWRTRSRSRPASSKAPAQAGPVTSRASKHLMRAPW